MGICYICKSQIPDTVVSCPVCGAIQSLTKDQGQSQEMQYGDQSQQSTPQSTPQQYSQPQPSAPQGASQYGSQLQPSAPQYSQQQSGSSQNRPQQYSQQPSAPQGASQYGSQPQQSTPQYGQQQSGSSQNRPQQYSQQPSASQGASQYVSQPQPSAQQNRPQQYSSPQPPAPGGSSGSAEFKKPVNKGLVIGLISGAAVLIAAVLLIFVFDVFGLKGGKPEKAAEAFINAYTEMDAQKMIDTLAPEVKNNIDELGMGGSVEEVQSSFDMLKGFGVTFTDIKIGEPEMLDAEKAKQDLKTQTGLDIVVKDAAKIKCSFNMHMDFMGETMDEVTELDLIVVKQGSKWYVANMEEIGQDDGGEDPIGIGGEDPEIGGSDSDSEEAIKEVAKNFMDSYAGLDAGKMKECLAPEVAATDDGSMEELQAA